MRYVPVVDKNNVPLMPTTSFRAAYLLKKKRAVHFWKSGIFCIRMLDREGGVVQPIAVGIDPGSKREGISIKSEHHTYLNIQNKAVDWVGRKIIERREIRRNRRYRKTPYRKCRSNRSIGNISPSIRARWGTKLRILNILKQIFPIKNIIIEDIKAETKERKTKWNKSFSPLEVGKNWFYKKCEEIAPVILKFGYETADLRNKLGLTKSKNKLANIFNAHCVDSWVLANSITGGHIKPDNEKMLLLNPLNRNRRKLHDQVPKKNGIRRSRNTKSIFQKGALVLFDGIKYLCGGVGIRSESDISLADMNGKIIKRSVVAWKCRLIYNYNKWGYEYV